MLKRKINLVMEIDWDDYEDVHPQIILDDAIKEVADGVRIYVSNPEWIMVKEQMPPNGEIVIGYFPDGTEGGDIVATAITYNGNRLISNFPNSTAHCFEATHWMPFPEPPLDPDTPL